MSRAEFAAYTLGYTSYISLRRLPDFFTIFAEAVSPSRRRAAGFPLSEPGSNYGFRFRSVVVDDDAILRAQQPMDRCEVRPPK